MSETSETLRQAVALMRKRAEAAQGEWPGSDGWYALHEMHYALKASDSATDAEADAEHIVSWHPTIALMIADWLEDEAIRFERFQRGEKGATWTYPRDSERIARAYLGADA